MKMSHMADQKFHLGIIKALLKQFRSIKSDLGNATSQSKQKQTKELVRSQSKFIQVNSVCETRENASNRDTTGVALTST